MVVSLAIKSRVHGRALTPALSQREREQARLRLPVQRALASESARSYGLVPRPTVLMGAPNASCKPIGKRLRRVCPDRAYYAPPWCADLSPE